MTFCGVVFLPPGFCNRSRCYNCSLPSSAVTWLTNPSRSRYDKNSQAIRIVLKTRRTGFILLQGKVFGFMSTVLKDVV